MAAATDANPGRGPTRPARVAARGRKPKPGGTRSQAGILQRTIRRDRDPAWPAIDRIGIELRAAQLRRNYVREAFATFGRALGALAVRR